MIACLLIVSSPAAARAIPDPLATILSAYQGARVLLMSKLSF